MYKNTTLDVMVIKNYDCEGRITMDKNTWKDIWKKRTGNLKLLQEADVSGERVLLELKKYNGFDVVGEGLTYESILQQYHQIKDALSMTTKSSMIPIKSVYEVGGGSGANLYLFERDGIQCGEIDYSESLVEIAKSVLQTKDIECGEAIDLKTVPQYDAVLANSVFSYFPHEKYALEVLEKMCLKAKRTVGIIDIHDSNKKEQFIEYRKKTIKDYEERYRGLDKLFYSKEFFKNFAEDHNMKIVFKESDIPGYWNNEFVFNCYFIKNSEPNE